MTRPVLVQVSRLSLPYATEDGETAVDIVEFVYGLPGRPQPFADAVAAAVAHAPAGRTWTVRGMELRSRDEEGSWAITAVTLIDEDDTEGTMTDDEYYGPARAIHAALQAA